MKTKKNLLLALVIVGLSLGISGLTNAASTDSKMRSRNVADGATKTVQFSTVNNQTGLNVDCGGGKLTLTSSSFTCAYTNSGTYAVSISNPDILQSLNGLSNAGITNFRGGKAPNISILDLSNNKISSLATGAFTQMTGLRGLELSNNQLTNIQDGLFSTLNLLSELGLGRNQITTIGVNAFSGLTELGNLHLESNNITSLGVNIFKDLKKLTYLALDRNGIGSLPVNIFNNQTQQGFQVSLRGNCLDPNQTFTNQNIDMSRKYNQGICATIVYDITTPTTGNVIGKVVLVGGTQTQRDQILIGNVSHTWTGNGYYIFDFSQVQGAWNLVRTQIVGMVDWIITDNNPSTDNSNSSVATGNSSTGGTISTGDTSTSDTESQTGSNSDTSDSTTSSTIISFVDDNPPFITSGGYYNRDKILTISRDPTGQHIYYTLTDYTTNTMQVIDFTPINNGIYITAKQYPDNTYISMTKAIANMGTIDQEIFSSQIGSIYKASAKWFTTDGENPITVSYGDNINPYTTGSAGYTGNIQNVTFDRVGNVIYVKYDGSYNGVPIPAYVVNYQSGVLLTMDPSLDQSGSGENINTGNNNEQSSSETNSGNNSSSNENSSSENNNESNNSGDNSSNSGDSSETINENTAGNAGGNSEIDDSHNSADNNGDTQIGGNSSDSNNTIGNTTEDNNTGENSIDNNNTGGNTTEDNNTGGNSISIGGNSIGDNQSGGNNAGNSNNGNNSSNGNSDNDGGNNAGGGSSNVPVLTEKDYDQAYKRCSKHNITSAKTKTDARLYDGITRAEMAKLIVRYVDEFKIEKETKNLTQCSAFSDLSQVSSDFQKYIVDSCNLGLMGYRADGVSVKPSFSPNQIITRAEAATVISRMIRGTKYAGTEQFWYQRHLLSLKRAGILVNDRDPMSDETRGDVFAMLSRI